MATHAGKGPRGWTLRDDRLIEEVSERLMEDRLLDARHVEVSANAGVVTLAGDVPGASDMAHAEMLARQTPGVTSVVNRLQVQPGQRAVDRPGPDEKAHYEGRWGRWVPPFIT
ncbi:BON domain-containing protein [Phenylobacterium sp.]|uniref:BON domain-containing protein n=1 Tax=Phenylobacterium sp. TaxID=1871053 RepID=UPI002ED82F52